MAHRLRARPPAVPLHVVLVEPRKSAEHRQYRASHRRDRGGPLPPRRAPGLPYRCAECETRRGRLLAPGRRRRHTSTSPTFSTPSRPSRRAGKLHLFSAKYRQGELPGRGLRSGGRARLRPRRTSDSQKRSSSSTRTGSSASRRWEPSGRCNLANAVGHRRLRGAHGRTGALNETYVRLTRFASLARPSTRTPGSR